MTAGKYFWLERDFGDEDKAEEPSKKGKGRKSEREATPIPDSSLDAEVQDLCRLIFNTACVFPSSSFPWASPLPLLFLLCLSLPPNIFHLH